MAARCGLAGVLLVLGGVLVAAGGGVPRPAVRVSDAALAQGSVDAAAGLAGALLGGLAGGANFGADGVPAAEPGTGGDSYGGEGKTFEPLFGNAKSTVIVLHGLSARVSQVVPLVPIAQTAGLTSTRFILPQAPEAYVNYRRRFEPSWMNMGGTTRGAQEFPGEIWATMRRLERIVEGERARGVQRVAVVGMSQGGAIASAMYMASAARLDGAVQLSAWLPDSFAGTGTLNPANARLKLLMVHGGEDAVISLGWAQTMVGVMRERGRDVDEKIIDGAGHVFGASLITAAKYCIEYLKDQGL